MGCGAARNHSSSKGSVAMIVFLFSCAQEECFSPGDYQNLGVGLMRSYCTSCHSSLLPSSRRYGAPLGVDFDTLEGIRAWSAESASRILEHGDMPPGGGMTATEKETLGAWLSCGAPGEEIFVPEIEAEELQGEGHNIVVFLEEDPEFANTLLIRREVDFGGSDLSRVGSWSEELYQLDGEEAWLLAYSQFDDPQTRGRSVFFDPPLPILQEEDSWSITVEMNIMDAQGEYRESVFWEGSKRFADPIDGQSRSAEPTEILMFSEQGEEWGWQFSEQYSITAQWVVFPNEQSWTTLQYAGDIIPGFAHDFPIKIGIMWLEHLVEE